MSKLLKMWPITIVFLFVFLFCYVPLVEEHLSMTEDKCIVQSSVTILHDPIYRIYWYVNKSSTRSSHEIIDFSAHYTSAREIQKMYKPGSTYTCYANDSRVVWSLPNITIPMISFVTLYLALLFYSMGLIKPIDKREKCSECGFYRHLVGLKPCGCVHLCYKCAKRAKTCNMCSQTVKHINVDRNYDNVINI